MHRSIAMQSTHDGYYLQIWEDSLVGQLDAMRLLSPCISACTALTATKVVYGALDRVLIFPKLKFIDTLSDSCRQERHDFITCRYFMKIATCPFDVSPKQVFCIMTDAPLAACATPKPFAIQWLRLVRPPDACR